MTISKILKLHFFLFQWKEKRRQISITYKIRKLKCPPKVPFEKRPFFSYSTIHPLFNTSIKIHSVDKSISHHSFRNTLFSLSPIPNSYSHICVLITLLLLCSNFNEVSTWRGDKHECFICHLELEIHYILQTLISLACTILLDFLWHSQVPLLPSVS